MTYKEQEVSLLLKLGRFEEGEKEYRVLLSMNSDNYRYYLFRHSLTVIISLGTFYVLLVVDTIVSYSIPYNFTCEEMLVVISIFCSPDIMKGYKNVWDFLLKMAIIPRMRFVS